MTLVMQEEIHKHHVAKQILINSFIWIESNQQQFIHRQTLWIWQVENGKSTENQRNRSQWNTSDQLAQISGL